MNNIKFIVTGGTIDDISYEDEKEAPIEHSSLLPELIKQIESENYEIEILMQKDSRFINENDRKIILKACKQSSEEKIIVSHGTFTLAETAKYLGNAKISKTIVLFGSLIPANKPNSDALENLKFAIKSVQELSNGVYVAMNGKVFNFNNVRKNLTTGMFEEIN